MAHYIYNRQYLFDSQLNPTLDIRNRLDIKYRDLYYIEESIDNDIPFPTYYY